MNVRPVLLATLAAAALVGAAGVPPVEPRPGPARPAARQRPRLEAGDVAVAGLGALALGLVAAPLAIVGVAVPVLWRRRRAKQAARATARAIGVSLPDAVDLLLLCAGAGLSLPLAHPVVAERAGGPVGAALARAARAAEGGAVRADSLLAELSPLGDRAAALAHVLVDHLRYGVPLVPALERLGLELRLARRRSAEEDARRVPVRLLAPLLCCVLPAFCLLTVVPLLVATLRSLPR